MQKVLLQCKNSFLFLSCIVSILWYGRRIQIPREHPKRVLVIMMAKLGDMVCATPIFHALKTHYPETKVYVLGNKVNEAVLAGNADVDTYLVFDGTSVREIVERIQKEEIDVAILRGPGFIGLVLALLGRVPTIIAPVVKEGKALQTTLYRFLVRFVVQIEYRFGAYMPRQMLRLLEPLGIVTDDTTKHLGYTEAGEKRVLTLFSENGIKERDYLVGITPSAGNKVKEWPVERFAALAEYIHRTDGARIVLLGGPNDSKLVESMKAHLDASTPVVDLAGKLSIDELKACVAQLHLFIGVDTGPIYIAEAFGVPTIDIVGPMDEREQPPKGERHLIVVPPGPRVPQLSILNARDYDYAEARRQAESITAQMVIEVYNSVRKKTDGTA